MKQMTLVGLILAGLLVSGAATTLLAQNGPGRGQGRGQGGGSAQSQEERAARRADGAEKNGGICPNGGPGTNCPNGGSGKGQGHRHGKRDGTGPRSANGTCPAAADKPAQN